MKSLFAFLFITLLQNAFVMHCHGQSETAVESLLDSAYALESTNPYQAISTYKEVIQIAERKDDELNKGKALSFIGLVFISQGLYDSLYYYSDRALEIFNEIKYARGVASIQNNLANAYLYQGFYSQALDYYQRALPYYEQEGQEYNLTIILNNIASMFQHNEDDVQSSAYLQRALTIAKELEDDNTLANTYNNISALYTSIGNTKLAYNYVDSAWSHILNTSDDHTKIIIGGNLIRTELDYNIRDKASRVLDSIRTYYSKTGSIEDKIVVNQAEALYNRALGNCTRAIQFAKESLSALQEFQDKSFEIDVLILLRDCYTSIGDSHEALKYANKLDTVKSQSFLATRNKQVSELEATYQNISKTETINKQKLQLEKQTGQRNLLIAISSFLLLLSGFGFYAYTTRKRRIEQQLQLQNEKVDNLEKQQKLSALDYIVQGQEEERKRIAQDLHDGLGGLLTSVIRQIYSIQEEIKKLTHLNLADDAERMIAQACDEVRRISHDMMPASLVSLGLQDALEDLIDDTTDDKILNIISHIEDSRLIKGDKEKVHIYRIVQEVFNNVIKHASASTIHLSIEKTDHQIEILIKDNGKGATINELESADGMGIQNIKARVNYLEGKLEIETKPGKGVSYHIVIPTDV